MTWGVVNLLRAWLLAVAAMVLAAPAAAQDRTSSTCHAYSDAMMSAASALDGLEWTCTDTGWQDGREVTWLRFDQWDRDAPPRFFTSRTTVFDTLTATVVNRDGSTRSESHTLRDARPARAGPVFTLPLPEITPDTTEIVVAIERPHSVTVASEAHLDWDPELASGTVSGMMLLAIVTGMLIMPLLFDILFYVVLRERFVLLHAGMTVAMILYVLTSGGVATALVTLPVHLLAVIGPLAWAIGAGFGGLFALAFLDPASLTPRIRRLFAWTGIWTMVVPGFAALQFDWMQQFDNRLYFYAFTPVIPIYFAGLVHAAWRGSRAARFLCVAWLPVLAASLDRLLRGLGLYTAHDSIDSVLFFALAFEVITVALAVADRFIAIRRQRDRALTHARELGELTERDTLTQLYNRRVIEDRFEEFHRKGFTTLALLDLDHFKQINDSYGHAVGDQVLRVMEAALQPDEDTIVIRMGGEEFAMLLRGRRTIERAEQRRQAVPRIVAGATDLDSVVTASMGVIEAAEGSIGPGGYEALYRRADQLLYEAKSSGRNRTMSERLRGFERRRGDRRAA